MLENLEKPTEDIVGCKIMKLAKQLGDTDGALLVQYVDDPDWIAEHLVKALAERGVSLGPMTVRKHRAGTCMCRNLDA